MRNTLIQAAVRSVSYFHFKKNRLVVDNVNAKRKGGSGREDVIGDERGEYDGTNKSNPVCDADIIQCIGESGKIPCFKILLDNHHLDYQIRRRWECKGRVETLVAFFWGYSSSSVSWGTLATKIRKVKRKPRNNVGYRYP